MKIGFLITARLKSSRLPLKLLKDLNGKSVIQRVIDRTKRINNIDDIVLCTTKNPEDKPLIDIAVHNNIQYFEGHEEDVLKRLLNAATQFKLDYFIGITAENPLFSIEYANQMVESILTNDHDYLYLSGLPIGCATYGARTKALEVTCKVKIENNTEIWGYFLDQPDIFNVYETEVKDEFKKPGLRITIDYPEDLEFTNNIFCNLNENEIYSFDDILQYLKNNPEIETIHKHRVQADLPQNIIDKINHHYKSKHKEIIELKTKIYNN